MKFVGVDQMAYKKKEQKRLSVGYSNSVFFLTIGQSISPPFTYNFKWNQIAKRPHLQDW